MQPAIPRQSRLPGRTRAILFDPETNGSTAGMRACAQFATAHGYDVACVARRLEDALHELTADSTAVLVVMHAYQLLPRVVVVTDTRAAALPTAARAQSRRPRRLP